MKMKKLMTSLMLTACMFASACSSGSATNSGSGNNPITGESIKEAEMHFVEGTLHDVNVDFNNPVSDFATYGQTNYKVVIGGATSSKAGGFISQHVYGCTGAVLPVIEAKYLTDVNANTQYILVGMEDLFVQLGGEIPSYDTIGVSGYQVQTVGKNVFINGYSENGYQMGAIAFLREVLGYDMLMEDLVIYEKDGKVMPSIDIIERPDFDYRQQGGALSATEIYGMGFTYTPIFITPGTGSTGSFCHNWYAYVSLEESAENPDWASNDSTRWQGCWTSRGNKDTYTGLINHLTEKVKTFLKANPTVDNLILGQHDIGTNTPQVQNCKCTSCQASYEYYGGTMAGAWLSLCNRVSLQVDQWLQTDEAIEYFGGVKDFNFIELVYHTSVAPPTEKDSKGNYILDEEGKGIPKEEMWFNNDGSMEDWDEAWTDENGESEEADVIAEWTAQEDRLSTAPSVSLMWAASASDWTHSYYESYNVSWAKMVTAWSGLEGDFFVWAYALNSESLVHPYNSFDTFFESTRFFKNLGAKWIFWQGNYENPKNGGFEKLHRYLESKVDFDVNSDYQYYVDKFFKYNYGVAGEYMQQYFEEVMVQCRYIEEANSINGNIHNKKLLNKANWPEGLMTSWINLLDKAYEAIEQEYKLSDPEMYEVYKDHITIEALFPRYVLCSQYENSYSATDMRAMRQSYLDDFYALGNKNHAEGRPMNLVSDLWDL